MDDIHCVPAGQTKQADIPVDTAVDPAEHGEQYCEPTLALNEPTAQAVHTKAVPPSCVPGAHGLYRSVNTDTSDTNMRPEF